MNTLHKDLSELLNKHSIDSVSNTPDFILAEYMIDVLVAYEDAIKARELHPNGN